MSEPMSEPNGEPKGEPNGESKGESKGEPNGESKGEPNGESKGEPNGKPNGKPKGEPKGESKGEPNDPETPYPIKTVLEIDHHSPIFLAHQSGREAEKYQKRRDFDRAIECHRTAIELLQEAIILTSFPNTIESLQAQKHYHKSQTQIIKAQQLMYFNQQQIELRKTTGKKELSEIEEKKRFLRWPILRIIKRMETLTKALREEPEPREPPVCLDAEKPDRKELMEKLDIAHAKLRTVTDQLLDQVDEMNEKIEDLQSKVDSYKREKKPAPRVTPRVTPA